MNTHKMQFGWIIEAPKYLSILTNQDGLVAIVSEYISSLAISTDKKIKISTSPFYEQQIVEIEKMNSDGQIID